MYIIGGEYVPHALLYTKHSFVISVCSSSAASATTSKAGTHCQMVGNKKNISRQSVFKKYYIWNKQMSKQLN